MEAGGVGFSLIEAWFVKKITRSQVKLRYT
jgi:hypothetical protein